MHVEYDAFALLHPVEEQVFRYDDYDGLLLFFIGSEKEEGNAVWMDVRGEFNGQDVSKQRRWPAFDGEEEDRPVVPVVQVKRSELTQ